jgi:site-specific recombinase XerD
MKRGKHVRSRKSTPKHSLNLPDLDQAKSAVLNSLPSKESQRGYRHAIDEFIAWYCSEPRLSFNRAVVSAIESTWNRVRLRRARSTAGSRSSGASRTKAADSGLLSPDLAAGIRRVKGPKNLGVRLGNWLTAEQARALWQVPDPNTLKGKRDRALLGILLGCGLRRREAAELNVANLQFNGSRAAGS